MFSRIRNHEKLVENGENPAAVAKKLKDGTHEKDSDPTRSLSLKGKTNILIVKKEMNKMNQISENDINNAGGRIGDFEGSNDSIGLTKTVIEMETEGEVKTRQLKNGSVDIEYNISDVIDLHSYVDPKSKNKSKGQKQKLGKGKKELIRGAIVEN